MKGKIIGFFVFAAVAVILFFVIRALIIWIF